MAATTGQQNGEIDELKCELCPSSGPPNRSNNGSTSTEQQGPRPLQQDDLEAELAWIECMKCSIWYHAVCIMLVSAATKATIPEAIRAYIAEGKEGSAGDWTDWTPWVDKWYCHKCSAWSTDPKNPRPPHHPLVSTVNVRSFPPKPKPVKAAPRRSIKRSPSTSSVNVKAEGSMDSSNKRRKIGGPSSSATPEPTHKQNAGSVIASATIDTTVDTQGQPMKEGEARPKRQAAMHRPDYHALHHHISTPTAKWLDLIGNPEKYGTKITEGNFPKIPGSMITRAWIESAGKGVKAENGSSSDLDPTLFYGPTREPLIITKEAGGFSSLGGKIPGDDFTVADVARLVGPDKMVDVIDVATQQSAQWTLQKWAAYVESQFKPKIKNDSHHGGPNGDAPGANGSGPSSSSNQPVKIYNVISLEITGTELANQVKPPTLVSEIDWVDNFWDFGPGGKSAAVAREMRAKSEREVNGEAGKTNGSVVGEVEKKGKAKQQWPKVQLYCLMGAKGSWTDWHVDFAASSVYYTIHTGAKTFFFIRPTAKNMAAYAEWSGSSEKQENVWLGDMCDEVRKVTLRQGDTMILPAGYIHAVHTPEDSIVFGGNFLHSYDIPTQLRLRQIEIDTKVPQRFRFPFFDKLCWYVAKEYCGQLRSLRAYRPRSTQPPAESPPNRVLHGLHSLAQFLIREVDAMEDASTEEKKRNLIHGRIPSDAVKDPSGLARELKWRVERELPELVEVAQSKVETNGHAAPAGLAKKSTRATVLPVKAKSRTWNFDPLPWKEIVEPVQELTTVRQVPRPAEQKSKESAEPETADEKLVTRKQARSRIRFNHDGSVVREEQAYTVVETITTWASPAAGVGHNGGPLGEANGYDDAASSAICIDG